MSAEDANKATDVLGQISEGPPPSSADANAMAMDDTSHLMNHNPVVVATADEEKHSQAVEAAGEPLDTKPAAEPEVAAPDVAPLPEAVVRTEEQEEVAEIPDDERVTGSRLNADLRWKERFDELVQYQKDHGDANVPSTFQQNQTLANWVAHQRQFMRIFKETPDKEDNPMTEERFQQLEKLNLDWKRGAPKSPPKPKNDEDKAATSTKKSDDRWMERYAELEAYFKEKGDAKVPPKYAANQSLANWVASQKHFLKMYREYPDRPNARMTEERAKLLERVNLEYKRAGTTSWEERYRQLSALYQEHGERIYVKLSKIDPKLAAWVSAQRNDRRDPTKSSNKPRLSKERVDKLNKINFKWHGSGQKWIDHYHDLVAYYEQNGHSKVPLEYKLNLKLGRWVQDQRNAYRLMKEGKKTSMTPEKIEKLEKLSFVWAVRPRETWETHYQCLKEFYQKNGNCLVPQRYEPNMSLGEWCRTQRKQYKLYLEDKNKQGCTITDEKVRLLNEISFEWKVKASPEDWMTRYNELGQYVEEYGDANVPKVFEPNRALGNWVQRQRKDYKLFQARKPTKITMERIELLERLGFQWQVREGFPKKRGKEQEDHGLQPLVAATRPQRVSPPRVALQRTSPARARAPHIAPPPFMQQQQPHLQFPPGVTHGYPQDAFLQGDDNHFAAVQDHDEDIESDHGPDEEEEVAEALAQAEREAQEAAVQAQQKARELEALRKRAIERKANGSRKKTRYTY